jgi:hypothetical protein
MAREDLIYQTHNAGLFHHDWDFAKDASVERAISTLGAAARDGVTAQELTDFVASALDGGQLTEREARQLSWGLREHYNQMSPEVRKMAEQIDLKLQQLVGNVHDASDERFASFTETVVLSGNDLDAFMNDVQAMKSPAGEDGETAQEILNEHNHDAGFLRSDWKFYTDASVDLASRTFDAAAQDGITVDELMALYESATDFGQISEREARQLIGAINAHRAQLSPEAREVADKLSARLTEAYPPYVSPGNFWSRPEGHSLEYQGDEQFRNGADYSNLKGGDVTNLSADLQATAHPLQMSEMTQQALRDAIAALTRV